jgi:dTDP-4-dehydrorhamnose 3,5-epimerase
MEIRNDLVVSDDRGKFVNIDIPEDFVPKRVYLCKNYSRGMVRAFHYHDRESKIIRCVSGAVTLVVCCLTKNKKKIDNTTFEKIVLTADGDSSVYIPPAHAHGWRSLVDGSQIMVISPFSIEESKNDDIRFSALEYDWEEKWR